MNPRSLAHSSAEASWRRPLEALGEGHWNDFGSPLEASELLLLDNLFSWIVIAIVRHRLIDQGRLT
jgi:hypothetical protein